MQPIPVTSFRNGKRDPARMRDAQARRVFLVGFQFLTVLCIFAALSGCMRQDYHFIGHMMDADMASTRDKTGDRQVAAHANRENPAASPAADAGSDGRSHIVSRT